MGCVNGPDTLTERTAPSRARLVNTPLPNVPPAQRPQETTTVVNDMGLTVKPTEETVKGTYTFDLQPTVTQVRKQTGKYDQFILYWGQPKPTDIPFCIVTVGPNLKPASEQANGILKSTSTRNYILNGLPASEWTGYTADRLPFCEIIAKHDEKGDFVQAVAIARTPEIRQAALDILASIRWEENR
jgi:hypothetical protein